MISGAVGSYKLFRPLAFALRAEMAHGLGKVLYRRSRAWRPLARHFTVDDRRLKTSLGPLELRNPVGFAAGFDKNAEMVATMGALGFGYTIPGSIRGAVASDNAAPKFIRYVDRESLVNCTGIPSKGAPYAGNQLRRVRSGASMRGAIVPSVQGFSIEEYVSALESVQQWADAIEIPLHCPNERYDELNFLDPVVLTDLLTAMSEHKARPFYVKIRNYHNADERRNRLRLVEICLEHGVDAITLPGSMTVVEPRLSLGKGNLSGRAVFGNTLRNLGELRSATECRIALKALGGIFTPNDAFQAIAAGASSVELLTGLIYRGWGVAREINRGLITLMDRAGIADVTELCGSGAPVPTAGR